MGATPWSPLSYPVQVPLPPSESESIIRSGGASDAGHSTPRAASEESAEPSSRLKPKRSLWMPHSYPLVQASFIQGPRSAEPSTAGLANGNLMGDNAGRQGTPVLTVSSDRATRGGALWEPGSYPVQASPPSSAAPSVAGDASRYSRPVQTHLMARADGPELQSANASSHPIQVSPYMGSPPSSLSDGAAQPHSAHVAPSRGPAVTNTQNGPFGKPTYESSAYPIQHAASNGSTSLPSELKDPCAKQDGRGRSPQDTARSSLSNGGSTSNSYPMQSLPAAGLRHRKGSVSSRQNGPHHYPVQPASLLTQGTPHAQATSHQPMHRDQTSIEPHTASVAVGSDSTTTIPDDSREGTLPKLPRHIRALKNSKDAEVSGRNVVVCLDGTGDKFDSDNSNIVHFVSCLKKSDPSQVTYYQSGIGTYDGGGLSNGLNAAMDMAVGSGLGVHIRDAYKFLMQNYHNGDRISLFGFSRGAYTARCLSGMIHKVGLLPAHNVSQIPFAYEFYKLDTEEGWEMSREFKRTFCADVSVHFIGVFDSVASVGFIPRTLPLSSTPYNKATYFRHAIALDEHRAKFKACRFQSKDHIAGADSKWETLAEIHENAANGQAARKFSANLGTAEKAKIGWDDPDSEVDPLIKRKRALDMAKETDVLEVWFAGGHADVGGGAVKNTVRHKLAQIPLRWMIRQCFECNTGIIFKTHRLAEEGLDVHTLFPVYNSLGRPPSRPPHHLVKAHEQGEIPAISRRATLLKPIDEENLDGLHDVAIWKDDDKQQLHEHWVPEQVEDYFDALAPINDQLADTKGWWILEFWPVQLTVQHHGSDEWVQKVGMNLGRYRPVQDEAPNLHWTVKQRMEVLDYRMKVSFDRKSRWNIVV